MTQKARERGHADLGLQGEPTAVPCFARILTIAAILIGCASVIEAQTVGNASSANRPPIASGDVRFAPPTALPASVQQRPAPDVRQASMVNPPPRPVVHSALPQQLPAPGGSAAVSRAPAPGPAPPIGPAANIQVGAPPSAGAMVLPINLPTALRLGNVNALDIAYAARRLQVATAQLEGTRVLWLPNLLAGTDYYRHDGQIQDVMGTVFPTGKQGFMVGGNPSLVFSVSEAIFSPLAARQVVASRQQNIRAANNDVMRDVADAYFTVQQARGELVGVIDAVSHDEELLRRVEKLSPGLVPPLEITRTKADLARRRQLRYIAENRWRESSAALMRVLNLEPLVLAEPLEPPDLRISLFDANRSIDEFMGMAIASRPELASQRALVQASFERVRLERVRPIVPSVMVRGFSTPVAGSLGAGYFGGGINSSMGNFDGRFDMDVQAIWQLQNLGFGTQAVIREREAENRAAAVELGRVRNAVAEDVVQSYALLQTSAARMQQTEVELRESRESLDQNLAGLMQTRRAGEINILVVRPQEVVAAVAAMSQAYADYFAAVSDYNRAQFRLYRAVGQPARRLLDEAAALDRPPVAGEVIPAPPANAAPRRP